MPDRIPLRRHNRSWLWQKVKDPEKPWQSQDLAQSLAPQQETKNVCEWILTSGEKSAPPSKKKDSVLHRTKTRKIIVSSHLDSNNFQQC